MCSILDALETSNATLQYFVDKNGFEEGHRRLGVLHTKNQGTDAAPIGVRIQALPVSIPKEFVQGCFELNTSLTSVRIGWPLSKEEDIERAIDYYTAHNEFSRALLDTSKAEMLLIFADVLE